MLKLSTLRSAKVSSLASALVLALASAQPSWASNCAPTGLEQYVDIDTNNIFQLSEDEMTWFHDLANQLHIVTDESTIEDEIAFLSEKCEVTDQDLAEVERHLRGLNYIKTASVTRQENGRVNIVTSDKWTLMPTLDVGRTGGKNSFALGLKDRNLLGYGIDTEIEYFSDTQRNGYLFETHFPVTWAALGNNVRGSVLFMDSDDGSAQQIALRKPFVSLDSPNAYALNLESSELSQQFFLNGSDYYKLDYQNRQFAASWGAQWYRNDDAVVRYGYGIELNKRTFLPTSTLASLPMPADRIYYMPTVSLEYVQDRFEELHNIHIINQIEDINFGWHATGKVGVNLNSRDNDESLIVLDTSLAKATRINDTALLLSDFSFSTNFAGTSTPRFVFDMQNEVFTRLSERFCLYGSQSLSLTKNQFLDIPVVIGEENGVRGYPLEFQRGNSRASFTAELRYYSDINIYNLFDVGAAVYADTGRTFASSDYANESKGWLSSVGIGARLYSRHASDTNVVHIDLSFPTYSSDSVDTVQFMVATRTTF